MDWKDVLNLLGGLCLFLFGMNIMGSALERRAGNNLKMLLGRMTTKKSAGLLTGIVVTAVIQSSSAATVMVVGFVNSGLMTLRQAINVIMGANIGTTVTAWILSLSGIGEGNLVMQILKPTSFSPVLALIGIIFYMFCKNKKKNDTGLILLGFATLMYGMSTMSGSVAGLANVEGFRRLFIMFENPILGVAAGAVVTAIIQSSSASVGILQALSVTGQITLGSAIPIIMGQNIGTCVTSLLSSVGTNKNAKRAAAVHLLFNIIGTVVCLAVFFFIKYLIRPAALGNSIGYLEIAVCHSVFNVLCTLLLLPMTGLLERLANRIVSDSDRPEKTAELDERLLATPPIALERCRVVTIDMAKAAVTAMKDALSCLTDYTPELAKRVRDNEEKTDHYEDIIGTYLVKLSSSHKSEQDSAKATEILKLISDIERISDHSVDILESVEELLDKKLSFSEHGKKELAVLSAAVNEILDLSFDSFAYSDLSKAGMVEPLEQIIDSLKDQMRTRHIYRLQHGKCSIETGFIWSDLLTSLERTSDHCSNIAACVIDSAAGNMSVHESLRALKTESEEFKQRYDDYGQKYRLEPIA